MPEENVTIRANFVKKTYRVYLIAEPSGACTFEGQGSYNYRNAIDVSFTANPGYEFIGWEAVLGIELTETEVLSESLSFGMPSNNVVLKAKFNKNIYNVSYDSNGGTGAPAQQEKFKDVDLELSSVIPTKTGYTFTGWNAAQNGTGTEYAAGSVYSLNEELTLYAQWSANSYEFSVETVSSKAYGLETAGLPVTASATVVEGYVFRNWTATGITLTASQQTSKNVVFIMPGNAVNLVANYEMEAQ